MAKLVELFGSLFIIFVSSKIGIKTSFASVCGGSLQDETGSFHSPGYPTTNYPLDKTCLWKINGPEDAKKILINFPVFSIEWSDGCQYDFVQILDKGMKQIGPKICGANTPKNIEVLGRIAYVKFVSDFMAADKGFLGKYKVIFHVKKPVKGNCDFDNGLCKDWSHGTNGDFSWTIGSGETPTQLTGPSKDHSGKGSYLFVESSSPRRQGDKARIISSSLSNARCMSFHYFMYGFMGMGSLRVYIREASGQDTLVWTRSGDYGRRWREASFPLPVNGKTPFRVIIEGTIGSSEYSDIAIDDIKFSDRTCVEKVCGAQLSGSSGSFVSPEYPNKYPDDSRCTWAISGPADTKKIVIRFHTFNLQTDSRCGKDYVKIFDEHGRQVGPEYCSLHLGGFGVKVNGKAAKVYFYSDHFIPRQGFNASFEAISTESKDDCDFDSGSCLWQNLHNDDIDWSFTRGETPSYFTGPYGDYLNLGKYAYIESSQRQPGDRANLASASMTGTRCMYFTYNLHGLYMGQLNILQEHGAKTTNLFSRSGDHGRAWHKTSVTIPDIGKDYRVVIQGVVGGGFTSDISVDEISFTTGACPHQPHSCGGYLTALSGVITSPRYPKQYPNNIACHWIINPLPYYNKLEIDFKTLDVEWSQTCSKDSVVIADGYKTRIGEKHCGVLMNMPDTKVAIRGPKGHVMFTSDSTTTGSGFQISYHVSGKRQRCGGELSGTTGLFKSPNYPKHYPLEEICEWELTSAKNKWIEITFKDFEIEDGVGCYSSYFLVYDGVNKVDVGRYCGMYIPHGRIIIKSHVGNIRFVTSLYQTARGFEAKWQAIDPILS